MNRGLVTDKPALSDATFREIDEDLRLPKGSAFRTFKRLDPPPRESQDFHLLNAGADAERIESLRRAGRIYPASIQVVLLSPALARRLRTELAGPDHA